MDVFTFILIYFGICIVIGNLRHEGAGGRYLFGLACGLALPVALFCYSCIAD